jgi:hypothetical protein
VNGVSKGVGAKKAKPQPRNPVVGALSNPHSDLEVSIFLTLLFIIVCAICFFFLLR